MTVVAAPAEPSVYRSAASDLLRNTLLDAALELLQRLTWAKVSMAGIAKHAGVSRQTLYARFASKAEVGAALVMRESSRFLIDIEGAVHEHEDDPTAALTAAFAVFLDGAAANPLLRAVVVPGDENASLLPFVTTQGQPVLDFAEQRLVTLITTTWPAVPREDAELLVDALVRLAMSYVTLPAGDRRIAPAAVMDLFTPYIERVFSRQSS